MYAWPFKSVHYIVYPRVIIYIRLIFTKFFCHRKQAPLLKIHDRHISHDFAVDFTEINIDLTA